MTRVPAAPNGTWAAPASSRSQHRKSPRSGNPEADLVLLVGDAPHLLRTLQRILEFDGHRVAFAANAAEVHARLADIELGVVLIDLAIKGGGGLGILNRTKHDRPDVEVVVITGGMNLDNALGCLRRGAFDYLARPFEDPQRVRVAVKRALERGRLLRRNRELERALAMTKNSGLAAGARASSAATGRSPVTSESLGELPLSLDAYEKSALERALREVGGDARAAARALGMGRSTLYRKLARYGLNARESVRGRARGKACGLGAVGPIG